MLELLLHGFPIVFALASFWSNTERKVLLLNLGLCVAVGLLLAFEQAWSGAIVITIAGLSTSYRLIKQKLLSPIATYITLITMLCIVLSVNNLTGKASFIETMPAFTFMAYRFGELYCKEAGLRICMILGSLNFTLYGVITETWGLAITEALFAVSNLWYYLRLRRAMLVSPV
ncbi:formyltetrahydrofolate deformylase [Alteromonas mediterranea MED64]|jgi:inner membrane protein|uniref:Formyltetrahydrofolate deformylase n=2 Tax=Alteromonas mediterranea TaxID=314275 RepID=S5AAR9_9ALTE|nr:YgjV family protein [Alteromonas mediterranea]AGP76740.1 formyltetrahydrofolate deformylase [Alteromonas mediterranea 615]AGP92207.1 formyltetrahydrofolate deformylase [Alteromonas mediterranea U8]MBR9785925.1 YgjV family protein [Gammaproteobacteria bacterium]MDY6885233.1 YgjV family protein [Pseudomonadota bacterium]AEA96622.1 formyltetrahydrofolate deformylase [Alteromonas mediterranea DE]|tara:strand:- start:961 stop:1479 length:519 start_codon:yes stop_codon:yes gene_type:complete